MNVKELLTFTPGSSTPSRDGSSSSAAPPQQQRSGGQPDRSRKRFTVPSSSRDEGGILKKPLLSTADSATDSFLQPNGNNSRNGGGLSGSGLSHGLEISDEERLWILQMVEEEPEVRKKEFLRFVVVESSYRIFLIFPQQRTKLHLSLRTNGTLLIIGVTYSAALSKATQPISFDLRADYYPGLPL
jgi:hypothetical protein